MDRKLIKYRDGMPYVPLTFPLNKANALLVEDLKIEKIIEYINTKKVESIYVCNIENFDFLYECEGIRHIGIELKIMPKHYYKLEERRGKYMKEYNAEPLYALNMLNSISLNDLEVPFIVSKLKIKLDHFAHIEKYGGSYEYVENLDKATNLKTLRTYNYNEYTLEKINPLIQLDTLSISTSKLKSLDGISEMRKIQCLYLHYNRQLIDISELSEVSHTLKALRIENCSKIEDFSVLEKLKNLELLEITGSNALPSLQFIKKMKNLKTFVFNVDVIDGDLTPCLDLDYVFCARSRKHFNLKDKDLPKGKYIRGNEDIDEWRRLE